MSDALRPPGARSGRELDLLYVGTLPPHNGGSAVLAGQLLPALAARGHRIRAIAPIASPRSGSDGYAQRHPGIDIERIVVPYFDSSPDTPPPAGYRDAERSQLRQALAASIARRRPDLVIAGRESFAPYLAGTALPGVLQVHGTTIWGILRETIPPPEARAFVAQCREIDVVVAVARHLGAAIAELGIGHVEVIENAIDADEFAPRPPSRRLRRVLGLADDAIVVMHVSNLKPLKRPLDIVASARAALQLEPRLAYVVVGDGLLRAEMEAACRHAGVAGRFRFTGWVEREEVPDYLSLADVVAMPSAAEARALVYLEAQACGRVLLASDIAAAREVVADGEDGVLFPAGDVEALVAATLELARDPGRREAIGRRARRAALGRTFARMVDEYETLLGRVARRPACRAVAANAA